MSFLKRGYHKPMCPECAWGKVKHVSQSLDKPKVMVYSCGTRTESDGLKMVPTKIGPACRRYQREHA